MSGASCSNTSSEYKTIYTKIERVFTEETMYRKKANIYITQQTAVQEMR